ncbi:MAG: MmgE/PrpD family protein [Solirubrobacteraceae bacterium]
MPADAFTGRAANRSGERQGAAGELARWATALEPSQDDLVLARRALLDTVAVMLAARGQPLLELFERLSEPGYWAAVAHVLDFDDLHMPSTTHISAVCVPAALASGGDERAYLAGAGTMARLGVALGWRHYRAGWHATCTAGAPAAAVTAAVAHGLDARRTAIALALAVPAAGGVQRAFGTSAKALQVGFAAEAGVRAAALAGAGASADPRALDDWLALVGGDPSALQCSGPAVPDGLAIKLFPCCYALQRPISALAAIAPPNADRVTKVRVATPASAVAPLLHHRPRTGLEGKFSLEYGLAATLLDGRPDLTSFTDDAVRRPQARRLVECVELTATAAGEHLLAGEVEVEVDVEVERELEGGCGDALRTTLALPPGAPGRPPSELELRAKLEACAGGAAGELAALSWESAAAFLRQAVPERSRAPSAF